MRVGPVTPCVVYQSPPKPLEVRTNAQSGNVVFDAARPYGMFAEALKFTLQCPVMGNGAADTRARIQQLIELGANTEWMRAGIYLTLREDGVLDANDGFYWLDAVHMPEGVLLSAGVQGTIDVVQIQRRRPAIGTYVDAKAQPNDWGLGGTTLAAFAQGVDATKIYPSATWSLLGTTSTSIPVVESPPAALWGPLTDPLAWTANGRCSTRDEDQAGATSFEVFARDHRFVSGGANPSVCRIDNGLLRVTLDTTVTDVKVEAWNQAGTAWVNLGSYGLKFSDSSTQALRDFALEVVSPEEVIWHERRFGAGGLFALRNRIRRGSRLIEMQVVSASGLGSDANGIIMTTPSNTASTATSADATGVGWTVGAVGALGFAYLNKPASPAYASGTTTAASFLPIAPGTVQRLSVLATVTGDAQYVSLGLGPYAGRWAAYNRVRVRQRVLMGG